jgi:hypothetical protein
VWRKRGCTKSDHCQLQNYCKTLFSHDKHAIHRFTNFIIKLGLEILFFVVSPVVSNSVSFACPASAQQIEVSLALLATSDAVLTRSLGLLAKLRNLQLNGVDSSVVLLSYHTHLIISMSIAFQLDNQFSIYFICIYVKINRRQQDSNLRPQRGTDF